MIAKLLLEILYLWA